MYNEIKSKENRFIKMKTIAEGQSLANLILRDRIYVDKTEYIFSLLRLYERVFISRPRRFGKSLTLDTIGTLFEYGVEPYFKDTWIYDKWSENTYPVLRLNFLEFSKTDIDEFKRVFNEKLSVFAKDNNLEGFVEDTEPSVSIQRLFTILTKSRVQIVILIDEYDTQLTSNINNVELYEKYQNILREIYGVLKGAAAIRFLGITGVTRIKDVALFSNGSDIIDISNHTEFSQMIGFTRDEIREYYIDYLKLAASCENGVGENEVTDSQVEEILDKLGYHYNGYCFDKYGEKKVFSTWSVNCFFKRLAAIKKCAYDDYWYDNGGVPTILKNYLEKHKINVFDYLNKKKNIKVSADKFINPNSLLEMDEHVLMCQTGYLTLRSKVVSTGTVALGIPNREIYKAIAGLMAAKFFGETPDILSDDNQNILEYGTAEEIKKLFNAIIHKVPYDRFPVDSEASVQSHILLYLLGAGQDADSEVHEANGRADLIVETDNRRLIFEFKYVENEDDAENKLKEAALQIKERDYGSIVPLRNELLRIAAVFNGASDVRAFTFEIVD